MTKDTQNKDVHNGSLPVESTASEVEFGVIQSPTRELEIATAEIWTMAEMLEAEPYPIPEIDESAMSEMEKAMVEMLEQSAKGEEGLAAGGQPEAGEPTGDEAPTATSGGYNYPPPFTRHEIFCPYTLYPYITIGRLFFKQNNNSYSCSAASIGNHAVWTAGHCVHSGNGKGSGWSTNAVFVPAYKDGSAPLGQWSASRLATRTEWYNKGLPGGLWEDMGGAILHLLGGKKISQRVGWLGFAWNWSKYQHWHALGYPAAPPFNGKRLNVCAASFAYNGNVSGAVKPNAIGCDMTGGCSGGPWILRFGAGNHLNGNNSYRRTSNPQELLSPHFDNRAKSLRDILVNGKP
jgi:V8-like Glu-specific endopeptidase